MTSNSSGNGSSMTSCGSGTGHGSLLFCMVCATRTKPSQASAAANALSPRGPRCCESQRRTATHTPERKVLLNHMRAAASRVPMSPKAPLTWRSMCVKECQCCALAQNGATPSLKESAVPQHVLVKYCSTGSPPATSRDAAPTRPCRPNP